MRTTKKGKTTSKTKENPKMSELRAKYIELYNKDNEGYNFAQRKNIKLDPKEEERINEIIFNIENQLETEKTLDEIGKKDLAWQIFKKIRSLENVQMTFEQIEKLYKISKTNYFDDLKPDLPHKAELKKYIGLTRRMFQNKYIDSLDAMQRQITDIETLKKLRNMLTSDMIKDNPIRTGMIKESINFKINEATKQDALNRVKYDVSEDIQNIIKQLALGELNIEESKVVIENEAQRRLDNRPKNLFAISEEQMRKQVMMQIRYILENRAEEFPISNPRKTIMLLDKLGYSEIDLDIQCVIKNLIARKEFTKAKLLCDVLETKKENGEIIINTFPIEHYRKSAIHGEIGDFILKGMNANGTDEEQDRYLSLIQRGLERGKIDFKKVPLGKSKDGLKDISLADIWQVEKKQEKGR